MIAVITFPNSWNSFFRIDVTADPAVLTLLIFLIWLKTKTNLRKYLFLVKILSFSATLSPVALELQNIPKKTLIFKLICDHFKNTNLVHL